MKKSTTVVALCAGLAVSAAANAQLTNGDFETGDLSGWTQPDNNPPAMVVSGVAHGGTYSALLGTPSGSEPLGDGSIETRVTVAPGQFLSFWYKTDTTDSITFDWQNCDILDSTGSTVLANVFHVCQTQDWTFVTYDLSAFVGQTISIRFLVHQDGFGDDTDMYVDDVAVGTLVTGACCTSDGCTITTSSQCSALSGAYHGDNSTCAQAGCPVNLVCNGGFESGAFTPCWTQFGNTGATGVNAGVWINTSPHGGTYEGHFGPVGSTGGITQTINVPAGTMITIDFWYAIDPTTPNFFSADVGGVNLLSFTDDLSHPTWTEFTMVMAAPTDNPVLTFTTRHDPQYVYLDDIRVTPAGTQSSCYANCDHSTAIPFLNVNDFICFQTHFASGDSYANCDLSTTPPVLNVNDFICFQTKFAGGCSAP